MQNIILIVHLILAVVLIAVVLLQRSEGGALGIGGGGGGGMVSSRGAASALSKVTWVIGVCFLCTSIALTIVSDGGRGGSVFGPLGNPDGTLSLPGPATPSEAPLPGLPSATVPEAAE
ncbi:MAG: preprotein translocase subunit SecG [Pseudomonadota bacterium]